MPLDVGIIGGTGGMGGFFAAILKEAGYEVVCCGRSTPVTPEDIAKRCRIVMVSVPIRSTVEVIRDVAPLLSAEQLFCDLTSLKAAPVAAMLESEADVLGLHPMFGPSTGGMAGQTIIAAPARCRLTLGDDLLKVFRSLGARVTVVNPAAHDRMMAFIQGLAHFTSLAIAETIRREGLDYHDLLACASPFYRIQLGLAGRLLGQDPSLYGDILQMNNSVPAVLDGFIDSAASLRETVVSGDPARFEAAFGLMKEHFGDYPALALEETDAMIRTLVTR
jgi:prephenate dehydrogenase